MYNKCQIQARISYCSPLNLFIGKIFFACPAGTIEWTVRCDWLQVATVVTCGLQVASFNFYRSCEWGFTRYSLRRGCMRLCSLCMPLRPHPPPLPHPGTLRTCHSSCPCVRTPVLEKVKKTIKKIVKQVRDARRQRNCQSRLRLNINKRILFEARNCPYRSGVLSQDVALYSPKHTHGIHREQGNGNKSVFFLFFLIYMYLPRDVVGRHTSAVTVRCHDMDQAASLSSVLQPGTRSHQQALEIFSAHHIHASA